MTRDETIKAICDLVRPVFHRLYEAVERKLDGRGVTVPQRGMLQILLERQPLTVPDLARQLLVKRQFALRLATELETAGLVERIANPAHKRSDHVVLTPAGRVLITDIQSVEARATAAAFSDLNDQDLGAAARVLSVMARASFEGDGQ